MHPISEVEAYFLKAFRTLNGIYSSVRAGLPQNVSRLMNGHCRRFTTDKLLDFLKRLDRKVTIRINPHEPGELIRKLGLQRHSDDSAKES